MNAYDDTTGITSQPMHACIRCGADNLTTRELRGSLGCVHCTCAECGEASEWCACDRACVQCGEVHPEDCPRADDPIPYTPALLPWEAGWTPEMALAADPDFAAICEARRVGLIAAQDRQAISDAVVQRALELCREAAATRH